MYENTKNVLVLLIVQFCCMKGFFLYQIEKVYLKMTEFETFMEKNPDLLWEKM